MSGVGTRGRYAGGWGGGSSLKRPGHTYRHGAVDIVNDHCFLLVMVHSLVNFTPLDAVIDGATACSGILRPLGPSSVL